MAGKFDPVRLLSALQDYDITVLSAAATHFRMMKSAGAADRYRHAIRKLSFTGEPMDTATRAFVEETFRVPVCSMYGTTEVGVILADYPGAADYAVKPGALGRPVPGVRVEVQRPDGERCAPDELGEIVVWRRGAWFPTKDRGWIDADGYFYHGGRADDAIISAGWTMSAVEIEDVLLKHPDVRDAAVIGVADALRGLVVKAFIVSPRPGDDAFARELQELVRTRLSQHEYPRHVAFVPDLPKTPAGKINRKALRDSETSRPRAARWSPRMPPDRRQHPRQARRRCSRRSPTRASTTSGAASASRSPTRSSPGATRPRATGSATTRTASATTIHSGAIRRTRRARPGATSSRRPASLRDEPHHLRLCRRAARRSRHVGRRRLDLASPRAAQ
jgi:hypothetical protein